MLQPLHSNRRRAREKKLLEIRYRGMDLTHNDVNVDFNRIIDSLGLYLNNDRSTIEKMEKDSVQERMADDDEYADILGAQLPDDDSNSNESSSDSDQDRTPPDEAQDLSVVSTITLYGERKRSFIRRLCRRLRFYILPGENNQSPPVTNIRLKKALLRRYFRTLNIQPEEYRPWFVAP